MTTNDENIAQLREKADQVDAARQEARTAKAEAAFLRAGLDPAGGPAKLLFGQLVAGDGELDVDAVKAAAKEYGIEPPAPAAAATATTEPPATTTAPIDDPAAQAALEAAANLNGPAVPPASAPDEVPSMEQAWENFRDGRKANRPEEALRPTVIDTLVSRAAAGKPDAVWSGWSPDELAAAKAADF